MYTTELSIEALIESAESVECASEELKGEIDIVNDRIREKSHQLVEVTGVLAKKLDEKQRKERVEEENVIHRGKVREELECVRGGEIKLKQEKEEFQKDIKIIQRVYELLNCEDGEDHEYRLNFSGSLECFRSIENKLSRLSSYIDFTDPEPINYNCTWPSPQTKSKADLYAKQDTEPQIEALIQKLEHYNESEKIFSKKTFEEEYKKVIAELIQEVTKIRKPKQKQINKL